MRNKIRLPIAMLLTSVCFSAQADLVNFVEGTDLPNGPSGLTTFVLDTPGENQWAGSSFSTWPAALDHDYFRIDVAPGTIIIDIDLVSSNVVSSEWRNLTQIAEFGPDSAWDYREVEGVNWSYEDIILNKLPFETGSWLVKVGPSSGICGARSSACSASWDWTLVITTASSATEVDIDIKPGSDPNCFNVNGHGVIPVAILGSDTFDANSIDSSTLLFGGLAVRVRGKKGPLCGLEYSNEDSYLDLVCHFEDDADAWEPVSESEASLEGELLDGTAFTGTDSICVVP